MTLSAYFTSKSVFELHGCRTPTLALARLSCYNFCREVCKVVLEEHSEPIGRPWKVIEFVESKFGKRKNHRGKRVDWACVSAK